ncbi:hypothetical protein Tco_1164248 [Tanacetum coccineum]
MPSISSPEPAINCFDDLDFFKGFENKFPAIVYNDAQTSKPDLLTKPILNPQHIDEFDLSDETSLSEYDEEEQNVLYFNDLFPFNIIRPDDLKSEKDKDDNDIDITQSLLDNEITHGSTMLFETNMALPPHEQRHRFLRYEGLKYTDSDIADFESRLERIYNREIYRVQVVDFQGMPELPRDGLFARMVMEHRDEADVVVFTSQAWRRMFSTRGPLVWELILEFLSTLRFGEVLLDLDALGRRWNPSVLLGPPSSYTLIRDPVLRLCHRMMAHSIAGRSQAHEKEVCCWEEEWGAYFWWIVCGTIGLAFWITDCGDSGRLTVAIGPERQPDAVADAPVVAEDALAVNEGDQAIPAPVQTPQQPTPPPPAAARTVPQRLRRLEEDVHGLRRDVGSLRGLVERLMTDQGRFFTCMMICMTQLMDASGLTYQAFDGTFRGSSPLAFQRRTKQRTDGASTSTTKKGP